MNNAIMQLKITRTRLEKELEELNIKLIRLLSELQSRTIPYFDNFEDIKAIEIEQIGDELLEVQKAAIKCEKKLKQVERELGCD